MPGIVGIISPQPAAHCQALVGAMISSMQHESFYTSGLYSAPELGCYAGWVALEQSPAARQPLVNGAGDVSLIFSGEWFANSPDEQPMAIAENDKLPLEKLNGVFSGLLIDKRRRRVVLFNDRYGLDRIYWHQDGDTFYFASEAKALLRILPKLREFDSAGMAQYLGFGCTFDWQSLFKGIQLLPGGSAWTFANGQCQKESYFSPTAWESQSPLAPDEFEARFREVFRKVVPRYFVADAPAGMSLTAGLDSRMMMACRPKGNALTTYTYSAPSGETLDDSIARRVAEACGLEHRLLRVPPDFFANYAAHVDRTVFLTDGCFGALGAHEVQFNHQARQLAPLRLTGVFGGEVLRGVSTFRPLGVASGLFQPEWSGSIRAAIDQWSGFRTNPFTFGAFKNTPWNLYGSWAASRSQVTFRSPYLDNELVALAYRTPDHLRTSPWPALRLIANNNPALAEIPTDKGYKGRQPSLETKLRNVWATLTFKLDYYQSEGLPDIVSPMDPVFQRVMSILGILGSHKFLQYRTWFRNELSGSVNDILTEARVRQARFWNPQFLEAMAQEHQSGKKNHVLEINAVITLEAIERLLFRDLPRGEATPAARPSSASTLINA